MGAVPLIRCRSRKFSRKLNHALVFVGSMRVVKRYHIRPRTIKHHILTKKNFRHFFGF